MRSDFCFDWLLCGNRSEKIQNGSRWSNWLQHSLVNATQSVVSRQASAPLKAICLLSRGSNYRDGERGKPPKILLFISQETSWPAPPVRDRREEGMNTSPLVADGNQEVCLTLLSLLLMKKSLNSNPGKKVLWGMSPPSSRFAGFSK